MEQNEQKDVDLTNDDLILEEEEIKPEPETQKKQYTDEEKLAFYKRNFEKYAKKLGKEEESKPKVENRAGELDKADYAILAAKGIEDEQRIDFIQDMMKKMGTNDIRFVMKDEYVQSKLNTMEKEQAFRNAIPGATKAKVNSLNDVDYWVARYEQTNELPDDFELRSAVVNKMYDRQSNNAPAWRK